MPLIVSNRRRRTMAVAGQELSLQAGSFVAAAILATSRSRTCTEFDWCYPTACTNLPTSDITASVCCLSADGGGDVAAVATASFNSGTSSANCPP